MSVKKQKLKSLWVLQRHSELQNERILCFCVRGYGGIGGGRRWLGCFFGAQFLMDVLAVQLQVLVDMLAAPVLGGLGGGWRSRARGGLVVVEALVHVDVITAVIQVLGGLGFVLLQLEEDSLVHPRAWRRGRERGVRRMES